MREESREFEVLSAILQAAAQRAPPESILPDGDVELTLLQVLRAYEEVSATLENVWDGVLSTKRNLCATARYFQGFRYQRWRTLTFIV